MPRWAVATMVVLMLMWQLARAQAPIPPADRPIQAQIQQVVTSLLASEANNAAGAHIPGVGVVFTIDLIRGPNTRADKNPFDGTRDWVIYLMQTFGAQMTTVPDDEMVAMSVDFYDYARTINHQLVVTSRRSDIADPSRYTVYLNSKPYAEAIAQLEPGGTAGTAAPPTAATPTTPAPTPTLPQPTGPLSVTLDFEDGTAGTNRWAALGGTWRFASGGYEQTQLNRFDLISYYGQPLGGDVAIEAQMQFVVGNMGGGLIFNAPSRDSKAGAHIVSYTAGGTFVQYGYFDDRAVFQYQGGTQVPSGSDRQPHTMTVRTTGSTYDVLLDGTPIALNVPLQRQGGYAGLFVSTSQVLFDNVKLSGSQP